jgi:hypothetical protein
MKEQLAYQSWPLADIHKILSDTGRGGLSESRFAPLGMIPVLLALPFYVLGHLPPEFALSILLFGWLLASGRKSRRMIHSREGKPASGLILFHSVDAALLLSVGLVCRYYWGLHSIVMLLAVAAATTNYLAYYSGVAFLKSVPAKVRLGNPELMVEVDHLFLVKGSLWGEERMIVIGATALGLLTGWPELGLAAAVIGGNIYWIRKSFKFWRRTG